MPSDPPAERLVALISAGWAAQALRAAAQLDLAEHLGHGPRDTKALARAAGCDAPALRRLLRALVTLDICRETTADTFELTELGAHLRADHPHSLRAWTLWWGGSLWALWPELAGSVRSGLSARARLLGTRGFEHLERDAAATATFHRAMAELTALVADRLARAWDFSRARRVVDVGGGSGTLLVAVLRAHPHLEGVLLEQAHALAPARQELSRAGVLARCATVRGDFFADVPAGADVYLLKSVLHDWDDEDALRILRTCRRAMGAGSRLLVIERVLPDRVTRSARNRDLARSDLTMLLAHGAGERSAAQLAALIRRAGLRPRRAKPLGMTLSVIEATVAQATRRAGAARPSDSTLRAGSRAPARLPAQRRRRARASPRRS